MKKILLIEALANSGPYVLDAARALGARVFVATHEDVHESYPAALRDKIHGTVFTDLTDPDRALADLAAFGEATGIDAVAGCWEFFTPLVAHLARRLGLPGNDPRRARACRNKAEMAQAFHAGQVPAPRTISVHTAGQAAHALGRAGIGFPVVVKPAEQGGSWGVSVVENPEQLDTAVQHAQSWPVAAPHGLPMDQRVVVQEYVPGPEFSLDTVVWREEYFHLPVVEKHTTGGAYRAETGHTCPAALPPADLAAVRTAVERALRALGIRNGVAHTELKIPPGRGPVVIEVGARLPGDHLVDVVRRASGIDEARAYLQAVLGEKPDVPAPREGACAIRFLTPPRAGTFHGVTVLGRHDGLVEQDITTAPGAAVGSAHDNSARLGHLVFTARTPAQVNADAAHALAHTRIEVS
ncbi:argininosuccinate lyase [Streptomyces filipinensis]|uniref:Argininosuccinate lyase n=1 Tax=Streptomyces filipinensis TaxID=66887 RepID=A0A918IG73_9ACTN|nr:ATP-grasp domain-containing protein [Streptomyces filipinensis]GGV09922.1 argininosuccinate lyase [Streptomyces filipinensis]